jgi:hypothetical protein
VSFLTNVPAGVKGLVSFVSTTGAYDTNGTSNVGGPMQGGGSASIFILDDCLTLLKYCTNGVGENGLITWTGFVTNCGNESLTNVVVTETQNGTNFVVYGPATLAAGAGARFTGSYHPADICKPSTDSLDAIGYDKIGCPVTAHAEATCELVLNPCIDIFKTCDALSTNGIAYYSGYVTNCGDVTLTNVVVKDTVIGVHTNLVILGPVDLAPNAVLPFSGDYIAPEGFCGWLTNTVTVTANDVCGKALDPESADCRTQFPCPPEICVLKGVVCSPQTVGTEGCDVSLTYGKFAEGIAGTNNPAFCYQIIVTNCGNDVLTNVTAIDYRQDGGAEVALPGYPLTLGVGESVTNYYGLSHGVGEWTNRVEVAGFGLSSGTRVTATNNAAVNVEPIGVKCDITLTPPLDFEASSKCAFSLFNYGTNQPVGFTLTVVNTGSNGLNVTIAGVPALFDCETGEPLLDIPSSVYLAVGGSTNIEGCTLVGCPGTNFNVSVQGTAVAGQPYQCIYDSKGNAITTDVSQCSACVDCVTPVTCRTTGGGTLIDGYVNGVDAWVTNNGVAFQCIQSVTSLNPKVSSTGLVLEKVTHGGQLGAPYAHKDCGEYLSNPCIRGQWEHVRHYKGKGNPRDVVDGFHTGTPKGSFDTLNCACLPCCANPDGNSKPQPNGNFYGWTNKFQLCNQDDHRICGPAPRPAPANALIWTGLGKLQQENDSGLVKGEWLVVRVFIVDRSEPGGGHPNGSIDPADIYCFQAWKTGVSITKKAPTGAGSGIAETFRRALGADSCAFLDQLATGLKPLGSLPSATVAGVTADISDVGPLHDGNRQIHPSTSATCTEPVLP